jgi:hypothetical protein
MPNYCAASSTGSASASDLSPSVTNGSAGDCARVWRFMRARVAADILTWPSAGTPRPRSTGSCSSIGGFIAAQIWPDTLARESMTFPDTPTDSVKLLDALARGDVGRRKRGAGDRYACAATAGRGRCRARSRGAGHGCQRRSSGAQLPDVTVPLRMGSANAITCAIVSR